MEESDSKLVYSRVSNVNTTESDRDYYHETEQNIQETSTIQTTTDKSGSSWWASTFILINACLGAGLLNIPAAYNKGGGLPVCISIQCFFAVVMCGSLFMLCYCSDFKKAETFQAVVQSLMGNRAQLVASCSVIVYAFGTCVCFFIIIGDQWDKFLTFAYGSDYCHQWYMTRTFTMVSTSLLLILPLCYPKNIGFLKYASVLGVLAILYSVFLINIKYFIGNELNKGDIKTRPDNWTDVFQVIPAISFGFQVHLSVIPVYSCLKNRTLKNYSKTLVCAMTVCLLAYSCTASLGYLTFGDHINEDILLSYTPISSDVLIAVILIAFKMYAATPILTFVGRTAIDTLWVYLRGISVDDIIRYEKLRRVIIATTWFASALTTAVLVPNIGLVIAFLGGLDTIFVFIFPGLCLLEVLFKGYVRKTENSGKYYFFIVVSVFYIVFGGFIFGLVFTQAVMSDARGDNLDKVKNTMCP